MKIVNGTIPTILAAAALCAFAPGTSADPTTSDLPWSLSQKMSPISSVTGCEEDPKDHIVFKTENGKIISHWDCERLSGALNVKDRICGLTERINGNPPPRDVCVKTCDNCNPLTPTATPTAAPSASPTAAPSASPTASGGCVEHPKTHIVFKSTSGKIIRNKNCEWLSERVDDVKHRICGLTEHVEGNLPPREICVNTCDNCDVVHPTAAPSSGTSPDPSSSPTTSPSLGASSEPSSLPSSPTSDCEEDSSADILFRGRNGNIIRNWDCGRLSQAQHTTRICGLTERIEGNPPPREICVKTCDTCFLLHPSAAPSSEASPEPTSSPSATPSLGSSSEPSSLPSSSSPECEEDSSADILFRGRNGNIIRNWDCERLSQAKHTTRICGLTERIEGNPPPREICVNTCDTCFLLHPSAAPSSDLQESPSSTPTSSPTSMPTSSPSASDDCEEDPKDHIVFRAESGKIISHWDCERLSGALNVKDRICGLTERINGNPPPRDVCVKTCDNCNPLTPTATPSAAPSASPTASEGCEEHPKAHIVFKNTSGRIIRNKDCEWLSERVDDVKHRICGLTEHVEGNLPPRDVCVKTCDNCNPVPPPTAAPSVACTEDPHSPVRFFNRNGKILNKTCAFLGEFPSAKHRACLLKQGINGALPPKEVCPVTCEECVP